MAMIEKFKEQSLYILNSIVLIKKKDKLYQSPGSKW